MTVVVVVPEPIIERSACAARPVDTGWLMLAMAGMFDMARRYVWRRARVKARRLGRSR